MRARLPFVAALAGVAVIAVLATLLVTGGGDEPQQASSRAAALKGGKQLEAEQFKLDYPKGWERIAGADLGVEEGEPMAAVRRQDGTAQMIVQRAGALAETPQQLSDGLTKRLKKEIEDFRLVRTSQVKIPAGSAISYTFVRTRSGKVQNLTVVPQGKSTYTLNSVVAGDNEQAAREVAAMVRSFDPES